MKKDSIIFITGSKSSLPFIHEAKNKGFSVILIDNDRDCPCRLLADEFFLHSASDHVDIYKNLKKIYTKYEFKGAMTYSSLPFALITVSYIADKFNLPSYKKESIDITYDKDLLHHAMFVSGCNIPKIHPNINEIIRGSTNLNFPSVLKLKSGIGSLGTKIVSSVEQIIDFVGEMDADNFILQEFVNGSLLRVDGFISNGNIEFLTFFHKHIFESKSVPLTKSFLPASQKLKKHQKSEEMFISIKNFIRQSGMDNNFFGADIIFNKEDDDFYIIEIGYLLDVKVDRLLFHAGLNPYSILIDIIVGNKIFLDQKKYCTNMALEFIYPLRAGKFNQVTHQDIIFEWEKVNSQVLHPPETVADILGWGIFDTNSMTQIPRPVIKTIQDMDYLK